MCWLINFFYYHTHGYPPAFCVAKGFGLNLRIITIAMYLSMMRTTMGYVSTQGLIAWIVPMGFNIQIHSFLGFSLLVHSFGHMIGHIVYHEEHTPGFKYVFTQKALINGDNWYTALKGDAVTGYILLGIIILMAVTALFRGASAKAYRVFFLTHYLYNIWTLFIFLHVPWLWPYFLAITAAMAIDRGYDFFHKTLITKLSTSRACHNGVTFLSVPRNRITYPGSYYRIKVPSISLTEWHPFSLVSGINSHKLTFFVASSGDWTRALHKLCQDENTRNNTTVFVQGPFYAPAMSATNFDTKKTLLVASGIGITPFFSVMATKVADERIHDADKDIFLNLFNEDLTHRGGSTSPVSALKKMSVHAKVFEEEDMHELRLVWMIRDCGELLFYIDYVHQLVKNQDAFNNKNIVFVDVYLTGLGQSSDSVYMISQTLFMLTLSDKISRYMNIHFGRPNLQKIFERVKPDNVYYCGGNVMQKILTKLCSDFACNFHPEDFDAGTAFIPGIQKYFRSVKVANARKHHKQELTTQKATLLRTHSNSNLPTSPKSPGPHVPASPTGDKGGDNDFAAHRRRALSTHRRYSTSGISLEAAAQAVRENAEEVAAIAAKERAKHTGEEKVDEVSEKDGSSSSSSSVSNLDIEAGPEVRYSPSNMQDI